MSSGDGKPEGTNATQVLNHEDGAEKESTKTPEKKEVKDSGDAQSPTSNRAELTPEELAIQLDRIKSEACKIVLVDKIDLRSKRYTQIRSDFEGCRRVAPTGSRTMLFFDTVENANAAQDKITKEGYDNAKPQASVLAEVRTFNGVGGLQYDRSSLFAMGIPVGVSWRSLKPCFPEAVRIVINQNMVQRGIAQIVYESEAVAAEQFQKGVFALEEGQKISVVYCPYRAFSNFRYFFEDLDDANKPNDLQQDPKILFNPPRRFWRSSRGSFRGGERFRGRGPPRSYRSDGDGRRRGNSASGDSVKGEDSKGSLSGVEIMRREVNEIKTDLVSLRDTIAILAKSIQAAGIADGPKTK